MKAKLLCVFIMICIAGTIAQNLLTNASDCVVFTHSSDTTLYFQNTIIYLADTNLSIADCLMERAMEIGANGSETIKIKQIEMKNIS